MRVPALLFTLITALAGPAGAQESSEPDTAGPFRATEIIGKEVQNPEGERLGQVREIVLDGAGRVRYLVLAYGGFLRMGDRLTAVPWDIARPALAKDHLLVALNRDTLVEAPTITADVWQDGDTRWIAQVERYYRVRRATASVADFASLDVNRDGELSPSEAEPVARLHDRFQLYDEDDDGVLSRSEFSVFEANEQPVPAP